MKIEITIDMADEGIEKQSELLRKTLEILRQIQAEEERIRQERGALARGSSLEREETATEMQEKHGIKQMLKVMNETLTRYLCDPQVTKACKKRMKLCMMKRIEEIYTRCRVRKNNERGEAE